MTHKLRDIFIVALLTISSACLLHNKLNKDESKMAEIAASVDSAFTSGVYQLDKTHASLIFKVNHLGLSQYTARFTRFDSTLELDVKNPQKSRVTAEIDPASLETDYPNKDLDFNAMLQGDKWLDAVKFPKITFRSTKVEITGENTARITGKLGLHGITKTVILDAKFNGGYGKMAMDPSGSRIGFSAHGVLKRADFDIAFGIPAAGSNIGVSDEVEFNIEAEYTKPLQNK